MANALITPTIITREAHAQLENALVIAAKVDRQHENEFKKIGNSVSIRKPVRLSSIAGPDITSSIVDVEEASQTLTLDTHRTVPIQFSATDLTLTIEDFSNRYIKPAAIRLAADVENSLAGLYTNIYNYTGTTGTVPSTLVSVGNAEVLLTNSGLAEGMERIGFYEPNAAMNLANALSGVNPTGIATRAIEKAMINSYAGIDLYRTVHAPTHTAGTNDGSGLLNEATPPTTYALSKASWTQTVAVDGFTTTDDFKAGDIFTMATTGGADVEAWNDQTGSSTGALQQFVITADATMSSGAGNLVISPPIITSGPYRTVNIDPGDDAVITVVDNAGEVSKQNIVMSPDAMTLAMANYAAPKGLNSETVAANNISITYSWDGDILTHLETHRFDILYGVKLQVPQFACRHTS